jgi:subtilisin family serine protease
MKKLLFLVVGLGFLFACTDTPSGLEEGSDRLPLEPQFSVGQEVLEGQYLLLLEDGVPPEFGAEVEALGGSVMFVHEIGLAGVEGLSADAAAVLGGMDFVKEIQADQVFELDPMVNLDVAQAVDAAPASSGDPAGAFFFPRQWNMMTIDADDAWAAGRLGSSDVRVAILDTGIDYEHADLEGLVDLSRSASFVPFDDYLTSIYFPWRHPVTDLHYHGTHVAATVASNAYAAAGVTSQTTLMGVKVCSVAGGCSWSSIFQGILFAVDHDADVINMSLGGGFLKAGSQGWVGYFNSLFNYVRGAGVTVVVSAGNDAIDLDHYPNLYKTYCSTPSTVCVSATAPAASDGTNGPWYDIDDPAHYTNFGRSAINVAAPGGDYDVAPESWVWAACSGTSLVIPHCQLGTYIVGLAGTSMAAPHVSGLAALMVEDVGRRPGQVKARIQQGADDLGQRGTDPFYGKGRINVFGSAFLKAKKK